MKVDIIDINNVVKQAQKMLLKEKISPAFKTIIELLIVLVSTIIKQLNTTSHSNKPQAILTVNAAASA